MTLPRFVALTVAAIAIVCMVSERASACFRCNRGHTCHACQPIDVCRQVWFSIPTPKVETEGDTAEPDDSEILQIKRLIRQHEKRLRILEGEEPQNKVRGKKKARRLPASETE